MITFVDGPAKSVKGLCLRRAPYFLRVTYSPDQDQWDALDHLDDVPRPDEQIYVYRLAKNDGMIHVNRRDKRGRHCGGFYVMATYALASCQPPDDVVRSNEKWRAWVLSEFQKEEKGAIQ